MSFYTPDVHTAKAVAFIEQNLGHLVISDLVKVEMTSALGIQVRRKDLSEALAKQLLTSFKQHCASGFYKQLSIKPLIFSEAEQYLEGFKQKLRSADALHLAVAKVEGLSLITLDNDLAFAAKLHNVNHVLL